MMVQGSNQRVRPEIFEFLQVLGHDAKHADYFSDRCCDSGTA
jgi:hypothetical protein